jgi:hypothetical protein
MQLLILSGRYRKNLEVVLSEVKYKISQVIVLFFLVL